MPYSSIPVALDPAIDALKIIASDTTIYIAPDAFGKTGSTPTWTGLTLGNDTTGDGTLAKPFATLKKAWEKALEYTITGNATVYIQFQKGIYELNGGTTHDNFFPNNLYHPQGGNIIIQGDPAAVKQKYLWRVANYSWNLGKFSHWGHTGDVYLWNLSGGTAHGFTGEDQGGYVAISNVSLGSAEWYDDPSQVSGVTAFRDVRYDVRGENYRGGSGNITSWGNWGNHFFSHGYPYEDSDGIVGLAKIYGATGSVDALGLAFKNQNLDSRVGGFYEDTPTTGHLGKIGPGLSNDGPWAGNANSWPESQLSEPNGYYGLTAERNINYPARPAGVTHISDEIFTVTNYPVVIRSTIVSAANKTPLVVRGGKIKAIRNLFFTTAAVDGISSGSQSLSYSLKEATPDIKTPAPDCLLVDDGAYVGIRHLGICGYNAAVRLNKLSTVSAYTSLGAESITTTVSNQHTAGTNRFSANSENAPLDNAPVLMSHLVRVGVYVGESSEFNSVLGSNPGTVYLTDASVWIQALQGGFIAYPNGKINLSTAWANQISGLPCFRMTLNIPVWAGSTLGTTAGFYNPEAWSYNTFRDVRLKIVGAAAGDNLDYIGRIYGVADTGVTFQTDSTFGSGWTGSTVTGYTTGQPLYTQRVNLYGYLLNGKYGSNLRTHRFYGRWVDLAQHFFDGWTCEIRAYSDEPGTSYVSGLCFDSGSITLQSQNGSFVRGVSAGRGFTAALHSWSHITPGGFAANGVATDANIRDGGVYMYGGCQGDAVAIGSGSSLYITKGLWTKGGVDGVALYEGSSLRVRQASGIFSSYICTQESAHNAIRLDGNSTATLGNVLCKHIHPGWILSGRGDVITSRMGSRVYHLGNLAAITWPLTRLGAFELFASTSTGTGRILNVPAGSTYGFGYWGGVSYPTVALTNNTRSQDCVGWSVLVRSEGLGISEFAGNPYQVATGWGHRVSAFDGYQSGIDEGSSTTSGAFTTNFVAPIISISGGGFLSPVGRSVPPKFDNYAVTPPDDSYSFAHMALKDTAVATGGTGGRLSSRKKFAAGANNFPMNCPAGVPQYQWWLHTKVGLTCGSHYKIPILLDGYTPSWNYASYCQGGAGNATQTTTALFPGSGMIPAYWWMTGNAYPTNNNSGIGLVGTDRIASMRSWSY
jgi:hypothetical protein